MFSYFLFYFEIVPLCVAFCFSVLPSVIFPSSSVFPFLSLTCCFPRLTPPAAHPLISVAICSLDAPLVFIRSFCYHPVFPNVSAQCLHVFLAFLPHSSLCVHWFVLLLALCLSSSVATLCFLTISGFLGFLTLHHSASVPEPCLPPSFLHLAPTLLS